MRALITIKHPKEPKNAEQLYSIEKEIILKIRITNSEVHHERENNNPSLYHCKLWLCRGRYHLPMPFHLYRAEKHHISYHRTLLYAYIQFNESPPSAIQKKTKIMRYEMQQQ